MENRFIPQAIDIVTEAIREDNNKHYKEALHLYKKALDYFIIGVKCAVLTRAMRFSFPWRLTSSNARR